VRFTFGTFKYAVREPAFRLATADPAPQFPNTSQSLRKATRIYHSSGAPAARKSLRRSLSGPYWKTPVGAGKASVAQDLLEVYIQLDSRRGRPAAGFDVKSDVAVGPDVIAVSIDVCLFSTSGFAPRLVVWDARGCSSEEARILLAPAVVAVDQEYGAGTAEDGELFDVRRQSAFYFPRSEVLHRLRDVQAALQRAQQ
jgi:hypothetical protein